jgi:hypothetical protein
MIGMAGGAGGYFGGGGANRGAGGGGSTYFGGLTSVIYYENGSNATAQTQTVYPGGITNPFYSSPAGTASSNAYYVGRIVIIPAY